MSSKLLFNSNPIVIDMDLANKAGLNEAIVLQQIHYWLEKNKKDNRNFKEHRYWTYNPLSEWHKKIPCLSENAVRRALEHLRKLKILITANFNKSRVDRTLWYTIDYDKLDEFMQVVEAQSVKESDGKSQMQVSDIPDANGENAKCKDEEIPNASDENATPIPDNNKPINKPNNKTNNKYIVEIVEYLNQICGTNYRSTTKKTQQLIEARLAEGFVIDEFRMVIDKMHKKWTGTEWQEYLRPTTLFKGDKFEGYLNAQVSVAKTVEGHKVTVTEEEDCPY